MKPTKAAGQFRMVDTLVGPYSGAPSSHGISRIPTASTELTQLGRTIKVPGVVLSLDRYLRGILYRSRLDPIRVTSLKSILK